MALLAENDWEVKLPDLPAYQEYKKLDAYITHNIFDDCNKLTSEEHKRFCYKIVNVLTIINGRKNNVPKNECYYFQHWLHDQISKKYYGKGDVGNYNFVVGSIFDIVSDVIKKYLMDDACRGNSFLTPKLWKEDKDLHDYFNNVDYIRSNCTDINKCKTYVEYVAYIDSLYNNGTKNCCYEDDLDPFDCNPSIKCDEKYRPQELLTELKNKIELLVTKIEESHKEGFPIQPKEANIPSRKDTEPKDYGGSHSISESSMNADQIIFPDSQSITESIYDKMDSSLISSTIITTSILGTIIFLFYYHISSTSGTGLHKKKKKTKNKTLESYFYTESEEELSIYDSESLLLYPKVRKSNLIYHPV